MNIRTAPYEPAKREAVLDLLERVWEERPKVEDFAWWFEQSPAGPSLLTLAEDGERVIGLASMSFLRSRVAGSEQLVAMPLQVATDPGYRGRGIFTQLEQANEEIAAERGCSVAVTFPNSASRPVFLERLDWHDLWRGRIWVRPMGPRLSRSRLRAERVHSSPRDAEIARLTPQDGSHQLVDAAFLDWRYLRSPRDYRVFAVRDGSGLRGLVVIRARKAAAICHLLAPPGDGAAVRALLSSARAPKASATIALPPPEHGRAFLGAGFLPFPKSVRVLGKKLRPEGNLDGLWRFQLGDFDIF